MKKIKYFFRNKKSANRKKILGPHAKGVIYDTQNGVIAMPVEDVTIGTALGFDGHWDINEINDVVKSVNADDVVYVVGTHVGTLLVSLAKKAKKVVGFEANSNTFWFMQMNLCLNHLINVQLFNNAVGNEKKMVQFFQNTVNTGGSKIKPVTDSIIYNYDDPKKVEVQMVTLDAHISENQLPQPQGMIMDIEGAEYFALQGMQKTLENVRFLYIEYVWHHLKNVSDVSTEDFLNLIHPHFKKAQFLKTNKTFVINNDASDIMDYMNTLASKHQTDDILFTK